MDKEISKSLSGTEVLDLLDNKCNLVQYSDLHNIKSIGSIMTPSFFLIVMAVNRIHNSISSLKI